MKLIGRAGLVRKTFHTSEEIISQPEIWRNTLKSFKALIVHELPDFRDYDQTLFIGCGSTYYLSTWAGRLLRKNHECNVHELPSSEMMSNPQIWAPKSKKTLLIAVSRSGETTETINAVSAFQGKSNGDVLAITCYPNSALCKLTDKVIAITEAQEESIAQTRSFTNMMLGAVLFISRTVPDGTGELLHDLGKELFDQYGQMAAEIGGNEELESFFFLGSGERYGLACEAMLKLKEMSLTFSEAYHFLEFRHGPMSMVNENSLMVGLLGASSPDLEISVLKDMRALGAEILVIGPKSVIENERDLGGFVSLDDRVNSMWLQPLYLPILQSIALERALSKGLNPDQPTNLEAVIRL